MKNYFDRFSTETTTESVKQLRNMKQGIQSIFQFERNDPSTDRTFSTLIDRNDSFLRKSFLQSSFKLYQIHTFHKLVNRLSETKFISLFHTNICSLQGNFDNLKHLIYN